MSQIVFPPGYTALDTWCLCSLSWERRLVIVFLEPESLCTPRATSGCWTEDEKEKVSWDFSAGTPANITVLSPASGLPITPPGVVSEIRAYAAGAETEDKKRCFNWGFSCWMLSFATDKIVTPMSAAGFQGMAESKFLISTTNFLWQCYFWHHL